MYLSNVALREEVNKHAELDPDAQEESSKCSPSSNEFEISNRRCRITK